MLNIMIIIICNLIAAIILISGLCSVVKLGVKIAGLKLLAIIFSGLGAFLLTPVISNTILNITIVEATETTQAIYMSTALTNIGVSIMSINSVLFLILFLALFLFNGIFYNIFKHLIIKSIREDSINKARLKRAKAVNAKAEKIARKNNWKEIKSEYSEGVTWWKKLIAIIISIISSSLIIFIITMPFGFIAKDLAKLNPNNQFMVDSYKYTLNGLIENKISFDLDGWLISAQENNIETEEDIIEEEQPSEETPCEHSFIEGVCEKCGGSEISE